MDPYPHPDRDPPRRTDLDAAPIWSRPRRTDLGPEPFRSLPRRSMRCMRRRRGGCGTWQSGEGKKRW
eukprot:scaffold18126_cov79-Isochrysis_galbana.AAC.1